jgi:hypothetical protein
VAETRPRVAPVCGLRKRKIKTPCGLARPNRRLRLAVVVADHWPQARSIRSRMRISHTCVFPVERIGNTFSLVKVV